jgi:hypothetical protein
LTPRVAAGPDRINFRPEIQACDPNQLFFDPGVPVFAPGATGVPDAARSHCSRSSWW